MENKEIQTKIVKHFVKTIMYRHRRQRGRGHITRQRGFGHKM